MIIAYTLLVYLLTLSKARPLECGENEASFTQSLHTGDFECAKKCASNLAIAHETLLDLFESAQRKVVGELVQVRAAVDRRRVREVVYLSPAFAWAQSPEDVFLSVKFSHKLDAPATLNVQHNLTLEGSRLLLEGSNGEKSFRLDLNLLRDISADDSTWSSSSNGRITITLRKIQRSKWARLLKDNSKKPSNMHFWHDKQETYEDELESLMEEKTADESTTVLEDDKVAEVKVVQASGVEGIEKAKKDPVASTSFETQLKKARLEELRVVMDDLDKEKTLRLAEVTRKAQTERDAIEKDIAQRKKEAQSGGDEL